MPPNNAAASMSQPLTHLSRSMHFWHKTQKATRLLLEPGGEQILTAARALTDIELVIGPEGGFSEREVAQARASNCEIMRLGPRILRTETAPVAALAILQFLYGDLA